jgi:hypothetical protein
MTGGTGPSGDADAPLDAVDATILAGIRDVFTTIDPPPRHLVERVQFALELEGTGIDVFRFGLDPDPVGATRGEPSRTITFDNDRWSVMIRISVSDHQRVRVDGWLAPPDARRVELRTRTGSLHTVADDQGRFAFDEIRHGLIQLVVHADDDDAPPAESRLVVTPSIEV